MLDAERRRVRAGSSAAARLHRIGEVVQATACMDCEHHQCQLELDSVHNGQPVQLLQGWTYMVTPRQSHKCRRFAASFWDPLHRSYSAKRETDQKSESAEDDGAH